MARSLTRIPAKTIWPRVRFPRPWLYRVVNLLSTMTYPPKKAKRPDFIIPRSANKTSAEINLGMDGVAILGGGVAGLALVAGLRKAGIRARVFDRAPALDPRGMGFILMPNGVAALRELFPALDWERISTPLHTASMRWHDGRVLQESQLAATLCVSRVGLISSMARSLPSDAVRYDSRVIGAQMSGDMVESVELEDGTRVRAGAFLGCDGVNSQTRRWMHPQAALNPVRFCEVVSVVDAPELLAQLGGTFRKFHHPAGKLAVGVVPAGNRIIWYVQVDLSLADMRTWKRPAIAAWLHQQLAGWPAPVVELLVRTDFEQSHLWNVADLDPLPNFHRGNLVLTGDAAHPVLSFTSQGAGAAIEDAVLLSELLRGCASRTAMVSAFAQFDAVRRDQVRQWLDAGRALYQQFVEPVFEGMQVPLAK